VVIQGDYTGGLQIMLSDYKNLLSRKSQLHKNWAQAVVKSNSKSFHTLCKLNMCPTSCPAERKYSARLKHYAIKAVQFVQMLFVYDPSSCSRL
jgi:hypothetical protein